MSLPNWVTVARIALVPAFLVFGQRGSTGSSVIALALFAAASASDSLDGYLARRRATTTRLGAFLDPLADKLLVGAALVVLVSARSFPLWAALVIGAREVGVQLLRTQIVSRGGSLPAARLAKLKTATQTAMVCWWLVPWDSPNGGHWLWLAAAVGTTLWSGAEYFLHTERLKEVAP
jgi:CDP-diacylglycerol---glycerol-3-phosphate 3-phosphatidyltransferase